MSIERNSLNGRATRHAALADVARLAVVDELALGDRSPSELQSIVGLPSNLLAHHVKVLESAGIVARRRSEGDRRRTYVTLLDGSFAESAFEVPRPVGRVVFVCTANSARSQLAAALWAESSEVAVTSAGTHPAEQIAEGARAVADRRSLMLASTPPRQFADVVTERDFVIAVCDNAYEELGSKVSLHWSIPDPVARGDAAFEAAFDEIDRRVTTLVPHLLAS